MFLWIFNLLVSAVLDIYLIGSSTVLSTTTPTVTPGATSIDPTVMAAVISSSATFVVLCITLIINILTKLIQNRKKSTMDRNAIRNELIINKAIAASILKETRIFGLQLIDETWRNADQSVVQNKRYPSDLILEIYVKITLYNLLNARYEKIKDDENYGVNKESRLSSGHSEMISLCREITELLDKIEQFLNYK